MKRLIIRADDLGYSEAVNYGIAKTVREGLIGSVGVMPNMPAAVHGLKLLADTHVCLGLHTNLCLGLPCAKPEEIPSLLDEQGHLRSSRDYREALKRGEEFTVLDEMVIEIEAQYQKYVQLTGQKPDYFEAHAVASKNLYRGLEIVAERHGLRYSSVSPMEKTGFFDGEPIAHCSLRSTEESYDPWQCLKESVETMGEDMPYVFVCHPGYLDWFLLNSSSLTVNRTKEVEMLCDPKIRQWLAEKNVVLCKYSDIEKRRKEDGIV